MPTDSQDSHSAVRELLRTVRRRWAILVLCAVLAPAAAFIVSVGQSDVYSASASLLFRDPAFDEKLFGSSLFPQSADSDREAATNVRLVSLDVVADRTGRRLGLDGQAISNKVTVTPEGRSDVASVTATDADPALAARIANTFASEYIAFRREADRAKIREAQLLVQRELGRLGAADESRVASLRRRAEELEILASLQTGNAELVQQAERPSQPSSPHVLRSTAVAGVLGLLLGFLLAIITDRLDRRIRDVDGFKEAFRRPLLAAIPKSRAISSIDEAGRISSGERDAFQMLRTNLRYFNATRDIRSVLLTSSSPGDGKTTVALNLAVAAAGAGTNTLLIEADLRRPTLSRFMPIGASRSRGLSAVLAGDLNFEESLVELHVNGGVETLDILPAGPLPPNPSDLLESKRMSDLLLHAQERYEFVVLDAPPLTVVSDAVPLISQVSGVIVIGRVDHSTYDGIERLSSQLEYVEAPTLGIVVNAVHRNAGSYYGYYGADLNAVASSS